LSLIKHSFHAKTTEVKLTNEQSPYITEHIVANSATLILHSCRSCILEQVDVTNPAQLRHPMWDKQVLVQIKNDMMCHTWFIVYKYVIITVHL